MLNSVRKGKDSTLTLVYLKNEEDGLPTRQSQDYAKDKLAILKGYLGRFTTAMKDKNWRALNYIDLQAGPGKNKFRPSGEILLGSPLLALTTRFSFGNVFLVEMGTSEYNALVSRVEASDLRDSVKRYNEDCNIAVDKIVEYIKQIDSVYSPGVWPCLNLAFLDPEGLEVEWQTVEKLANLQRMDLIINFSTNGITRNAGQMVEREEDTIIDRFFGTREWRLIYEETRPKGNSEVRRELIDFYLSRLKGMGYVKTKREEKPFKNERNVQVYTMIFASKHDLGIQFWNDAVQEVSQPRLF